MKHGLALLAVLLALPAAAAAQEPDARLPSKQALRGTGVRVAWPLGERAQMPAGSALRVRVIQRRAGRRRVTVSLVRYTPSGRPRATEQRRVLRRGVATLRVPEAAATIYQLRLSVAGRRYWSWVETPQAPDQVVTNPPASDPPPPCSPQAQRGISAAQMALMTSSGRVDDRIRYTITNTGERCVELRSEYVWERQQAGGSWTPVPRPEPYPPRPAVVEVVVPGQTREFGAWVWPTLQPGRHRLRLEVSTDRDTWAIYAGPFDVTG